jgi:hypothetical protein
VIDESELRAMSVQDRAALSHLLVSIDAELPSLDRGDRRRNRLVLMLAAASVGLIPWTVLLAVTLPPRYLAGHWTVTWVGFDSILLTVLALTAWLAWRRRQAVVITAFIAATLLTCDAWFDITTSSGRTDTVYAVLSAVFLELPLAALLFAVAHHLLTYTVRRARAAQGTPDTAPQLFKIPLLGVRG